MKLIMGRRGGGILYSSYSPSINPTLHSTKYSSKPAFMAALMTKALGHNRFINHLTKMKPFSLPKDSFHLSKSYTRFPHSIFRKTKEAELGSSAPISLFLSSARSSFPKPGLISWYLSMVKTRPIFTKSITSAFIYTAADLSSQTIETEEYDLVRTLRMAGCGMLILGPSLHYWFNFVSVVFPKHDLLSTFKKMALGQGVFGPAMTVVFFSVNAALQGESGSETVARLKRDFLPTTVNGLMYWPVCDFLTFKFFPVHLQPLVSNSFSYIWTVYMTYMASLEKVATS